MKLARAQQIVADVVANAPGPVTVWVVDSHGELVAAASMDGAAHDTKLNARRKAYTAAPQRRADDPGARGEDRGR